MTSVAVRDARGKKTTRTLGLPDELFDVQVNVPLIHQVVVAQLAAARQGTSAAKGRGDVRGGGRKPHRQKGTGRARQGSNRAPHFTGGGVVHGPTPRAYTQRTPKRMKAASLAGALSDRARGERLHVVSRLVTGEKPATRKAVQALERSTKNRPVLVVAEHDDTVTFLSLRNVPDVHVLAPEQLNTYDVLVADDVVFTEAALQAFCTGPVGARLRAGELSVEGAEIVDSPDAEDDEDEDDAEADEKPAKKTAAKKSTKKAAAKKADEADDGEDEEK
ncbi:MAG: 50S ribosomal protein L4 [Streptosporangiales bacterium]|nr:50S ribosomal protein L4 [Streptosporangiales bacterium]MBO0890161.1 50S ribosomal protein L4 [Acidothermales bacterium]